MRLANATTQAPALHHRSQLACRAPSGQSALMARRAAAQVTCMAHPRRVAKVAKQIEREVGQLLISDKTMQAAVCPERRRGFDGALSALASVTEVQISNDLQVAKVYLSIYSDDVGKEVAMEGLQRLEGYVRKHIGKQIRLRLTPEIRFVRDDSIERSERILKLLDQVKKIERGEAEPPPLAFHGEEEWSDEEEEGDELELEGGSGSFEVVDLGMFGGGGGALEASVASAPLATTAAAAPLAFSGQQQRRRQGGGGGSSGSSSSVQQRRGGKGDVKEVEEQSEEEVAAMLAEFKLKAERRGWSRP